MDKLNSTGKAEKQYMNIKQKRIYDEILVTDGKRILLDRLWPRGIKKEVAQIDLWPKGLSPSNELRKWYHEAPEQRWDEFQQRYLEELAEQSQDLDELWNFMTREKTVTFLTASKNTMQNHLTVIVNLFKQREN